MGERRAVYRVLVRKHEIKSPLGDPGVDGRIILRWILQEVGCVVMDWIELSQDRDRWRAVVNVVMNLWVT
jgi:hypothetical protein